MKLAVALGLALFASSALASEVGAPYPQSAVKSDSKLTLALAEQGAGTSWTVEPIEFKATAHQTAKLNKRIESMNAEVSAKLDALIASKLEQSIAE
jgi:hypothetical protein